MAPELFFVVDGTTEEESPSTTKASDVYSFALLVLEVRGNSQFTHAIHDRIPDSNF
jgi:hypothetical protein